MKSKAWCLFAIAIGPALCVALPAVALSPRQLQSHALPRALDLHGKVQRTKSYVKIGGELLSALQLMESFVFDGKEKTFRASQTKFRAAAASIKAMLIIVPPERAAAVKTLNEMKSMADEFLAKTAAGVFDQVRQGRPKTFRSSTGQVAVLGADGGGGLLLGLKIMHFIVKMMMDEYGQLNYAHVWEEDERRLALQARRDGDWDARLLKVGLGQYIAVLVESQNHLGREVVLEPATDKFTIVTVRGRRYANVNAAGLMQCFDALANLRGTHSPPAQGIANA